VAIQDPSGHLNLFPEVPRLPLGTLVPCPADVRELRAREGLPVSYTRGQVEALARALVPFEPHQRQHRLWKLRRSFTSLALDELPEEPTTRSRERARRECARPGCERTFRTYLVGGSRLCRSCRGRVPAEARGDEAATIEWAKAHPKGTPDELVCQRPGCARQYPRQQGGRRSDLPGLCPTCRRIARVAEPDDPMAWAAANPLRPRVKLSAEIVHKLRWRRWVQGETLAALSRSTGVGVLTIRHCTTGVTWPRAGGPTGPMPKQQVLPIYLVPAKPRKRMRRRRRRKPAPAQNLRQLVFAFVEQAPPPGHTSPAAPTPPRPRTGAAQQKGGAA